MIRARQWRPATVNWLGSCWLRCDRAAPILRQQAARIKTAPTPPEPVDTPLLQHHNAAAQLCRTADSPTPGQIKADAGSPQCSSPKEHPACDDINTMSFTTLLSAIDNRVVKDIVFMSSACPPGKQRTHQFQYKSNLWAYLDGLGASQG